MSSLSGKVALVTGASRGIGAAIARRLAADGAAVAIDYAGNEAAAAAVVAGIVAAGGEAEAFRADVSDPVAASALVDAVLARFGRIDVLVNNAGITRDGLVLRMSPADWDAVIATNLSGAFHVTKAAARSMLKARSGSVIDIASVVGLVGNAGQANYAAAKAGLIGMTKALAREFAPRGVRVNAVAPGFIETDMTRDLPEKARQGALGDIALGRFGSPDDIAAAVAFLASEDASYITGQTIAVDGGMVFS